MQERAAGTIPLEQLELLQWRLERIYDAELAPVKNVPYVNHPTAAWLVRCGQVRISRPAQKPEHYKQGQWVFPGQAPGLQSFTPGTRILSVRFHVQWLGAIPVFSHDRSFALAHSSPLTTSLTNAAESLLRHLESDQPAQVRQRQLGAMTLDSYIRLQPPFLNWICTYINTMQALGYRQNTFPSQSNKVRAAFDILQSHPLHQPLQIADLARRVAVSVSQLNKLFVAQTQTTPAKIWNQRRLHFVRGQLLGGDAQIKAIAAEAGFTSPESFNHWFRNQFGCTPGRYRKLHTADNP